MNILDVLNEFASYAFNNNLIEESDVIYLYNKLMGILKIDYRDNEIKLMKETRIIDLILDDIIDYAISKNIISDYLYERDLFDTMVMDFITPLPSTVNKEFFSRYKNKRRIIKRSGTRYFRRR